MNMEKNVESSVSVIPATKRFIKGGGQIKTQTSLRVAAYCRVSTGDESQQTSYTNQKAFYTGYISRHPGWRFSGIYADEAISGTSRAHRVQFNQMIEDAKAGKMDYIVTKSISRFARNTVDTLNCVRELRQLSPPVGIFFEKENIDTLDATGELILTILSALAQDESRSMSDNIRWTFQKNFASGKPQINLDRMLGYEKGKNGDWVINEAQAEIVRFIFQKYVCGHSANAIADQANTLGYRTINGKLWRADTVLFILRNEKYVGDLEMQKTVTKDFLTHKSTKNTGEAPKYYVMDHHTGIIDRFTWEKAQIMLGERKRAEEKPKEKKKGRQPTFTNLTCGAVRDGRPCGEPLLRMTYSGIASGYQDERSEGLNPLTETEKYSYQFPVWRCKGAIHSDSTTPTTTGDPTTIAPCPSSLVQECALEQSFMEMLYSIKRDYEQNGDESWIAKEFQKSYDALYSRLSKNSCSIQRMALLDAQIKELEENLNKTVTKQVSAMREAAFERDVELNEALAAGEITLEDIDIDIRSSITGVCPADSSYEVSGEAAIYADLARDLRERLEEYRKERRTLETEQRETATLEKNYRFFLECLKELPEENAAGMKMNVNGRDVEGSIFREYDGTAKAGKRSAVRTGHLKVTAERIRSAPDYLRFERGIYAAFIQGGVVMGDMVVYRTNFGVKLLTTGNSRTLGSFLGFRRCRDDGTVEFLDEIWKVNDRTMTYRRKERKRVHHNNSVE